MTARADITAAAGSQAGMRLSSRPPRARPDRLPVRMSASIRERPRTASTAPR